MKTTATTIVGKSREYPGNSIQLRIIRGEINRACGQEVNTKFGEFLRTAASSIASVLNVSAEKLEKPNPSYSANGP